LFGLTIGAIDALDIFGGDNKGTPDPGVAREKRVKSLSSKYAKWSKTALINVDGSHFDCNFPGIRAGNTIQDTGRKGMSFSVNVLNVSM
jgi:hypothetical protein